MPIENKYMTVDEVAEYLGFEKQTIYNKVHNNEIPFHKIGPRAVRFKKEDIDNWIQRQQERERQYIKKGDKYYLVINTPLMSSQMLTEKELLEDVKKEAIGGWYLKSAYLSDPLVFDQDDLKNAKEILKRKLVYPRLIKGNTPVYEFIDSLYLQNYLIILKLFKDSLTVNFLPELKKKLIENVKDAFYFPVPDLFESRDATELGFHIETVANDLLSELINILLYLAGKKKDPKSRFLPYANRYFDKNAFLNLYMCGFCYFDKNPFSGEENNFILRDKTIDQLNHAQIILGIKANLLSIEDVIGKICELESHLRTLKVIVKVNRKGGVSDNKD